MQIMLGGEKKNKQVEICKEGENKKYIGKEEVWIGRRVSLKSLLHKGFVDYLFVPVLFFSLFFLYFVLFGFYIW